jgi:hypothetical protein
MVARTALLAVVWIIGAVWVALNPPVQSGPPQFDETLPFLKLAPDGRVFGSPAECRTAAKQRGTGQAPGPLEVVGQLKPRSTTRPAGQRGRTETVPGRLLAFANSSARFYVWPLSP